MRAFNDKDKKIKKKMKKASLSTLPAFGWELVLVPHPAMIQATSTQLNRHYCYVNIRKYNHQARTSSRHSLTSLTVKDLDNRHNHVKDTINLWYQTHKDLSSRVIWPERDSRHRDKHTSGALPPIKTSFPFYKAFFFWLFHFFFV